MSGPSGAAAGTGDDGAPVRAADVAGQGADFERRFGGLARLHGEADYRAMRAARVAVVGVGGVGSWAAEALARCGVASLVLIDLDHVAESNVQRQVQALGATLGQAKVDALAQRLADIHPGCVLHAVDAFASADNWPALLPIAVDVVVDACDQGAAKLAMADHARRTGALHVVCGAAGGKCEPTRVQVGDLADATHDPLLSALRQRLRRAGAARRGAIGLRCVYSAEPVRPPIAVADPCALDASAAGANDGSLNCHGYGSTVFVTAAFGLAAASEALDLHVRRARRSSSC